MNIFTVSFFGHRMIDNPFPVEEKLESLIRELLYSKEYVEFLMGRDGEFDQIVASTVRRCKRSVRDDNSALVLVLPYLIALDLPVQVRPLLDLPALDFPM